MKNEAYGSRTIAPGVLHTIVRLTTLGVSGVSNLAPILNAYDKLITRKEGEGVKVVVNEEKVYIDIYVVLNSKENVRVVSKNIQQSVSRSITEMVGLEVASVNVHITDIDFDY